MRESLLVSVAVAVCFICIPCTGWGQTAVTTGSSFDYQGSVVRPWDSPQRRIVVFERLDPDTLSGDLYATLSEDDGETWSEPAAVITSPANERHAEMVQTGAEEFQLFYLSDATGSFKIHHASSTDGENFVHHGALDLGWASGGEINPHVIRLPEGRLVLAYHRLGGAAYLSWSDDNGLTWDTGLTQISPGNAALPRIAWREADKRLILTYQTGSTQLQLWSRTTTDLTDWNDTPVQVAADGNNHDSMPLVLENGHLAVFWAREDNGGFQIFSAISQNAAAWSGQTQHTDRPGLADIQPHPLLIEDACIDLYWGAEVGPTDYNVVRQNVCMDDPFRRIGGTVTGLQAGSEVVLQNNGGDDLTVGADGPFIFGAPIEDGSDYQVTILTQPADPLEICAVSDGSGTVAGADVTGVRVDCEVVPAEVFNDRFEHG